MPRSIAETLLPEFDHEWPNTRRVIERVPDNPGDYKPHEKSRSFVQLATHVVELPSMGLAALTAPDLDVAGGAHRFEWRSTADALARFDRDVRAVRERLAAMTDEEMKEPWTLKSGSHVIFTLPRVAAYRSFLMNHMIHHRAQLAVYLRLNNIPVPGMYGPSADEM